MATTSAPFGVLPLARRLWLGACGGAAFGAFFGAIIVVTALSGGRYQAIHSDETDVWALAALYPTGAVVSGLVVAACGPLWRSRWSAAPAAAVSVGPLVAAISVASGPHGPTPYRVDWGTSALLAVCFAVVTPFVYDRAVARGRAHAQAVLKRRRPAA